MYGVIFTHSIFYFSIVIKKIKFSAASSN